MDKKKNKVWIIEKFHTVETGVSWGRGAYCGPLETFLLSQHYMISEDSSGGFNWIPDEDDDDDDCPLTAIFFFPVVLSV